MSVFPPLETGSVRQYLAFCDQMQAFFVAFSASEMYDQPVSAAVADGDGSPSLFRAVVYLLGAGSPIVVEQVTSCVETCRAMLAADI